MYSNFILSLYIIYELNDRPHNASNNFPLKYCSFGTVKLLRNAAKSKFTCNGWGTAFDGEVHAVLVMTLLEILQFLVKIIVYQLILIIKKKVILELSEGPTDGINYGTDAAENNWVLALARQIQNLA